MATAPAVADSRSATLHSNSAAPSLDEKPMDPMDETPENEVERPAEAHVTEHYPEKELSGEEQQNETPMDPKAAAAAELKRINTHESGMEYPTGARLGLISLALCLSVFLIALDNTIIATAIPKITDQFNSLNDVGWYGSAYLLTTAAFQLLFGKFYTFFSIKWVYLAAISIFELGSLLCGVAPNSSALIVGRAIAGVGSAGIFSGALIIIAYSVPLDKRPMYSGFIGAMYGIASVAGPLLGGVFTDKSTWRWCFYINLPIGGVTIAVITFFLKSPQRAAVNTLSWRERMKQLDLEGTFFFMPAIICLLLALQWGGSKYEWGNGRIIALFIVFGILITIFIGIQFWKKDLATIPPRIISKRSIWSACWFSFCLGAAFFIMVYYIPIWFQAVEGASAVQSGIRSIPLVLGLVIVSIISGIVVTITGYYNPWMIGCTVVMSVGFGLISTFKVDTPQPTWIGYLALGGMGVGMGMQQPLMAIQNVLDISDVPTGTSLLIFLQTLGGSLFVSVGQNVFQNKLISGLARYAPTVEPALVLGTGATSIQSTIPKDVLPGVTLAYNYGLTQAFLVATAMAALSVIGSLVIEWKSMKGKKIEMAAA